ncbi:MAG: hypothetical protein V2A70_00710, partial [Candidatus Omnitrophota bacterium]
MGLNQKIKIIKLDPSSIRNHKLVSSVVVETLAKTQAAKEGVDPDEGRIDFHNRVLQHFHFSYKVDKHFAHEIDAVRDVIIKQLHPAETDGYRIISKSIYRPYEFEFALRSGPTPIIAVPFVMNNDIKLMELDQKDETNFFNSDSPLIHRFGKNVFYDESWWGMHDIFSGDYWGGKTDDTFYYIFRPGLPFINQTLFQLFLYNETVDLIQQKEILKLANPVIPATTTTMYSLPGDDFTRPDDDFSYENMLPDQLFQTVEGLDEKSWREKHEIILKRYSKLIMENKINPRDLMSHLLELMTNDFNYLWKRDRKSWDEGMEYYVQRAEKTRAVLKTIINYSRGLILNDDFLAAYYSRADKINEDGTFSYNQDQHLHSSHSTKTSAESNAINYLAKTPDFFPAEMTLDRNPLLLLLLIMDIAPEYMSKKMADFLIAIALSASDRYKVYLNETSSSFPQYENFYEIVWVWKEIFPSLGAHPEHFAKLFLEAPRFHNAIKFLLNPIENASDYNSWAFDRFLSDDVGLGEEEPSRFLPDSVIQGLISFNTTQGNQMNILQSIMEEAPDIAGETILAHWKFFDPKNLGKILGFRKSLKLEDFLKMEEWRQTLGIKNYSTALFLAINPSMSVNIAKNIDDFFSQGSSLKEIFEVLMNLMKGLWSEDEIRKLYATTIWTQTSTITRSQYIQNVLNTKASDRPKLFVILGGKKLTAQNTGDIYPLNIPYQHPLDDKYNHELKHYFMEHSSFIEGEDGVYSRESETEILQRINHRNRMVLKDLDIILKHPLEDIQNRIGKIQDFETQHAEIDNTAYRLLLVVPHEDFESLFKILTDNFNSLKNSPSVALKIQQYLKQLGDFHPEIKECTQKHAVGWAARQLGITSRRRLMGLEAGDYIKRLYVDKLKAFRLGNRITRNQGNDEDRIEFLTLTTAKKLLTILSSNKQMFSPWLTEIPDVETDPRRLLPAPEQIDAAMTDQANHDNDLSLQPMTVKWNTIMEKFHTFNDADKLKFSRLHNEILTSQNLDQLDRIINLIYSKQNGKLYPEPLLAILDQFGFQKTSLKLESIETVLLKLNESGIPAGTITENSRIKLSHLLYLRDHSKDFSNDFFELKKYLSDAPFWENERLILFKLRRLFGTYGVVRIHHLLLPANIVFSNAIPSAIKSIQLNLTTNPDYVPSITGLTERAYNATGKYTWSMLRKDDRELLLFLLNHNKNITYIDHYLERSLAIIYKCSFVLRPCFFQQNTTIPKEALAIYADYKNRLFAIIIHLLHLNIPGTDILTLIGYMNMISQRTNIDSMGSLLSLMEHVVTKENLAQDLNSFLAELSYLANTMLYREATEHTASLIHLAHEKGITNALDAIVSLSYEYAVKTSHEASVERMVQEIEGLSGLERERLITEISAVLALENEFKQLTEKEIHVRLYHLKTGFRQEHIPFDDIKLPYLAGLREIIKRHYGLKAFNVQLASVLLFFSSKTIVAKGLAEQIKTGEGKSLIIILTASLAAVKAKNIDIFTVNTYLAKRDAEQYSWIY